MDYKGGTYISQEHAASLKAAVLTWVKKIDVKKIGATKTVVKKAPFYWDEGKPVPIDGTEGVWCFDLRIGRPLAIVHVIHTTEGVQVRRGKVR